MGKFNSSIRYNRWREGMAIILNTIVGIRVQINSIIWFSKILFLKYKALIILIIKNETKDKIVTMINIL